MTGGRPVDGGAVSRVKTSLDEDLAAFIRSSLPSVWALEMLLLLRRTRDRRWGDEELVREMRASVLLVAEARQGLERVGLVRCDAEGCGYAPASSVLEAACDRLEAAYRTQPVAVANVILSAPKGTLQTFADAFRVKGKGEGK